MNEWAQGLRGQGARTLLRYGVVFFLSFFFCPLFGLKFVSLQRDGWSAFIVEFGFFSVRLFLRIRCFPRSLSSKTLFYLFQSPKVALRFYKDRERVVNAVIFGSYIRFSVIYTLNESSFHLFIFAFSGYTCTVLDQPSYSTSCSLHSFLSSLLVRVILL